MHFLTANSGRYFQMDNMAICMHEPDFCKDYFACILNSLLDSVFPHLEGILVLLVLFLFAISNKLTPVSHQKMPPCITVLPHGGSPASIR